MVPSPVEFPVGSSVVLDGLVAGAEHNGKAGVVRSPLDATSGRQKVYVVSAQKHMSIRPGNLKSNPHGGMSSSSVPMNRDQLREGAERMSQMSPESLRRQASTMRAMGPAAMRSMNPQMAGMSDAQIDASIVQMEAMANDPAMMRAAAEQMKGMTPEDITREMNQATMPPPAAGTNANAGTDTNITADQFQEGVKRMTSMTPEQLKGQAAMLRSTPVDTLRKTNPQMAKMTDEQIQFAITQMETMANDPNIMKMAAQQMNNMTPDQYQTMKKMTNMAGGSGAPTPNNDTTKKTTTDPAGTDADTNPSPKTAADPSSLLMEALMSNPEHLSTMVKTMKQNTDLMKNMLAGPIAGSSKANQQRIQNAIEQFATMEDSQVDKYLTTIHKLISFSKPFVNAWVATKNKLRISHKALLGIINFAIMATVWLTVCWVRGRSGEEEKGGGDTSAMMLLQDEPPEITEGYGKGEF